MQMITHIIYYALHFFASFALLMYYDVLYTVLYFHKATVKVILV